jgi:hypothetical protein
MKHLGENDIKRIMDTPLARHRCKGLPQSLLVIRVGWVEQNMAENSVGDLGDPTSHEAVEIEGDSAV